MRLGWVVAAAGCLAVLVVMASCADAPDELIRATRAGLADLRDGVHATRWASADYAAASAAVEQAEKEIASQGRWPGMLRDYGKTMELLRQASADIARAREAAIEGKKRAQIEASEALEAAGLAIGHAEAALMIVPVARDSRSSFERLDDRLARAGDGLEEVRNLITAEKYDEASARARVIVAEISTLMKAVGRAARH